MSSACANRTDHMIPTPAAAERFRLKPRTFMEKVREHAVPRPAALVRGGARDRND